MDAEHQPTKKLFDAVMTFRRLEREHVSSLEQNLQGLNLTRTSRVSPATATVSQNTLDARSSGSKKPCSATPSPSFPSARALSPPFSTSLSTCPTNTAAAFSSNAKT
ncbi:hypothetical protein QBC46DRAFT_381642 [Diplogelasinospora grovesii]|uniref:Uncharacterized protein n=1 Tax=Diplogelasinospora grovesii TaxID=303347 RepID=A0AAN6S5G9_9PEZI|nr:hypothetical protein QBC46DRAFT_381642 [Diplogelasinospora grovesii]